MMASDNPVSFHSFNFPDRYVRHKNFLAELEPISSDLDKLDASFHFHGGLAPGAFEEGTASYESVNFPGFWLRHQDFRLKLQQRPPVSFPPTPELELFDNDATFLIVDGLADNSGHNRSFKSVNFNMFLRHRDFHLFLQELDLSNDLDKRDATFEIVENAFRLPPP
jgi:hypothetical protein